MSSIRKRKALVALLEDPDERIYLVVSQVIRFEGLDILELLLQVVRNEALSDLHRERARKRFTSRDNFLVQNP